MKHPPRALSEIFDQKLSRVRGKTTRDDAFRMLQYCGVMKRPLSTREYKEVLSLSPGQKSLDRGNFPNDMNRVISHCCGLTCVDEEDNTVHYVHQSVKQHLFDNFVKFVHRTANPHLFDTTQSQISEEFNTQKLDRHIGVLCMTYLDFADFKRQLKSFKHTSNTPIQPVRFGVSTFSNSKGITGRIGHRLLLYSPKWQYVSAGELERKAEELVGAEESSRLDTEIQRRGFHFLEYARNHWINHLTDLKADSRDENWSLFRRCLEGDDIVAYRPWESAEKSHKDKGDVPLAIQWLSTHGHFPLLRYYEKHQPHLLTKEANHYIFQNFTPHGHQHLMEYIYQQRANSCELMEFGVLLIQASRVGFSQSFQSLLRFVPNIITHAIDKKRDIEELLRTSLLVAAKAGHDDIVRRLLREKANFKAPRCILDGRTPLEQAAGEGHLNVVKELLAAKADIHAISGFYDGRTALEAAKDGNHLEIVQRLLAAQAEADAPAMSRPDEDAARSEKAGKALEALRRDSRFTKAGQLAGRRREVGKERES